MDVRKLAAVTLAALVPVTVQAQTPGEAVSGLYLGAGLGGNSLLTTDVSGGYGASRTAIIGASSEFEWGYAGVLSLGWGFGNGLRAEIEGSYRQNSTKSYTEAGSQYSGYGAASSYGAMLNVLYDIDLGEPLFGMTPYVGAGVGYIWHEYKDVGYRNSSADYVLYNGTSGAIGGQAIAGLSFPVSAFPGLAFTAEYRFMMTAGHKLASNPWDGGPNDTTDAKIDNYNHSILVGLRYAFNAAPTVVSAAPITAARTYLVFFDWNKADLTDRAKQILGDAASGRGQGVTRIEVNGYTDRSGSDHYNQGLSERRANAVAAELVRRGVPRNEIVTRGFGEANPLIPTADGVREPQNRRVEIILR
ncbi:MAG: hypothetical protein RLZZ57_2616 [Pseudomonadota bacterium]|jgi:OmpA-OmpF porin, OOP family